MRDCLHCWCQQAMEQNGNVPLNPLCAVALLFFFSLFCCCDCFVCVRYVVYFFKNKRKKKNMSIPTKTHNLYIKDGKIWSRYFWSIIDLLYRAVNMRVLLISAVNLGILCKDCVKDASALRSKDDIQFHQHCNGKNSRLESSRWVITESTSNFITMTLYYKKCD